MIDERERATMVSTEQNQKPMMQRLYDRVWLLAILALLFWAVTYLVWGLIDIFSIPSG